MLRLLSIVIFLIISGKLNAQRSVHPAGENVENGYVKVWLNNDFKTVKDSSSAQFYRFTPYEDGKDLYNLGYFGRPGYTLETSEDAGSHPKMLNGIYTFRDKKGITRSVHSFKNGYYLFIKEFDAKGNLVNHWDYARRYKGEGGSYYYTSYKNGKETRYVFYKGLKGYMLYFVDSLDDGKSLEN